MEDDNLDSDNEKNPKYNFSAKSTTSSKGNANLGYTPIRRDLLEYDNEYILRWLNYHVLTTSINTYPEDVINSHG